MTIALQAAAKHLKVLLLSKQGLATDDEMEAGKLMGVGKPREVDKVTQADKVMAPGMETEMDRGMDAGKFKEAGRATEEDVAMEEGRATEAMREDTVGEEVKGEVHKAAKLREGAGLRSRPIRMLEYYG